jgi:hypothetical protein
MKRSLGTASLIALLCAAVILIFMALRPAHAHRMGGIQSARQTGVHWCTWSAATACTRWRNRGGKFICPPGVNSMSCRYQRREIR